MLAEDENPENPKKKRGPGRPKKDEHYGSLTITMPPEDLLRLNEQVKQTGRSRSQLLRDAWNGQPITPLYEPGLDAHYDQLIVMTTTLNQLLPLQQLGAEMQDKIRHILFQVEQKMGDLNGRGNA